MSKNTYFKASNQVSISVNKAMASLYVGVLESIVLQTADMIQ